MKNLTWQNPEQLFVAQELINKVKSKCCGIKDYLLLSIILRKEYEVHRAHDGQEAIEKFEGCRPDMILMDIKMPVMDGLEATRRIRLKGGTLPIIALTANAYDSDRDKAFEAGCDDYMAKPIMAPALREMIEKYFGE